MFTINSKSISINHIRFASSQGIFQIITSANVIKFNNGVKVGNRKLIYDENDIRLLYILEEDSVEWKYLVDIKKSDGLTMFGLYNDNLQLVDYTLYPNMSVLSLQQALKRNNCAVFVDIDMDIDTFDFMNRNTPNSLILATTMLLSCHIQTKKKRTKENRTSEVSVLITEVRKLIKSKNFSLYLDKNIAQLDIIPFGLTQLCNFLDVYTTLTDSEQKLIRHYILKLNALQPNN